MNKRPTKRALVFVGAGALLMLVGTTAQSAWLFVLAAAVIGAVACSLISRARLAQCQIVRKVPSRAQVGDNVPVQISIRNLSSRRSVPGFRVIDSFEAVEAAALACDGLGPDQTSAATISRKALRRGILAGGEVTLITGWPFGLTCSRRTFAVPSPVTVVPRTVELRAFPVLDSQAVSASSHRVAARAGAGEQFLGVREYRAGDDARHIHWRSSARRSRLVMREYENEATELVALVLAGGDDGHPPNSSFEVLVSAVASVAIFAHRRGLITELVRGRADGTVERFRSSTSAEVLDWLATARAVDAPLLPSVTAALDFGPSPGAVVLFATAEGRAGLQIHGAVRLIRARGPGVVTVVADSTSWREGGAADLSALPAPVRILSKGRGLAKCLQG
jgi:uncharacterized protein (DUF58 family)